MLQLLAQIVSQKQCDTIRLSSNSSQFISCSHGVYGLYDINGIIYIHAMG